MANAYLELKKKHQDEVNAFPMEFAFDNKQFKEAMERLGLTVNDTDKVCGIDGGGIIRKTDKQAFIDMFKRHDEERKQAIEADETGDGYIYQMFNYELANHEFGYTGELEQTLDALGLTMEEINASSKLLHGLQMAVKAERERD